VCGGGENVRLRIFLFGQLAVRRSGRAAVDVPGSCWPLLAFLIVRRGLELQRNHLSAALWPDSDETHARRSLNTAIWRLRRVPEFDRLLDTKRPDTLSIRADAPLAVDTEALLRRHQDFLAATGAGRATAQQRLKRVLDGIDGVPLPQLDAEWAVVERQRFVDRLHQALLDVAQAEYSAGQWRECIRFGHRLSLLEPLREDVHRLLMRAYIADGQRAKAVQQYRRCQGELGSELGIGRCTRR
jgi:DNA-binding SARP family transcriptional activator